NDPVVPTGGAPESVAVPSNTLNRRLAHGALALWKPQVVSGVILPADESTTRLGIPAINVALVGGTTNACGARLVSMAEACSTVPCEFEAMIPQGLPTGFVTVVSCAHANRPSLVSVPDMVAVPSRLSLKVSPSGQGKLGSRERLGVGYPVVVTRKEAGTPGNVVKLLAEVIDSCWVTAMVNVFVTRVPYPVAVRVRL